MGRRLQIGSKSHKSRLQLQTTGINSTTVDDDDDEDEDEDEDDPSTLIESYRFWRGSCLGRFGPLSLSLSPSPFPSPPLQKGEWQEKGVGPIPSADS
ncbi:hypothetical protein M5D96_010987 [Drosophila gunungcola]|uniref:Uncharacterized protein n=1 Tax=Drosophila gunungcola TaxID=103775 RepID=A0A9Q0BL24_9MUSC|nr:hypothetical protein M5D96_010987 [Drosophila gunungcola]